MDMVHSSAESHASHAISFIAKMIQRISCYEKMLHHQQLIESARDEVREELAKTSGVDTKSLGFVQAEDAFLGALKAKVELLNASQQREKVLEEELRVAKETHKVNLVCLEEHMKADFERQEKEIAELKAKLAKGESRIAKYKNSLKVFPARAVAKYTKGFCLA